MAKCKMHYQTHIAIMRCPMNPNVLTVNQTAARLQLHRNTIRRRVADGSLPSSRIGCCVRIPLAAVERIERGEQPNEQDEDVED